MKKTINWRVKGWGGGTNKTEVVEQEIFLLFIIYLDLDWGVGEFLSFWTFSFTQKGPINPC